jgi:quinol monooxygenase YgiN
MIIVHGTLPITPAQRDDAMSVMREMAVASRTEYGCLSYEFYVGVSDPNTMLLFQEWESLDAYQGHFDTEHMADFMKVLPDVLDGEITTRRYEVRSSRDVPEEPMEPSIESPRESKIIH